MSSTQDGPSQYGPQQPYGQPQNGPQQYGYQQYGPPGYGPPQPGPQQYGPPPYGPPQAVAPQKRKKWPWILLAVFVIVVGMFACNAGGGQDAETTSGTEESASGTEEGAEEADEGEESLGIGDTGQVGDWMVTVNGTQTATTMGGEFYEEQAQGEFVIVDMMVENGGSDATYFDDSALSLIDADGNSHSASSVLGDDSFFLQQINPGNQATGTAAFDIPEGTEAVALKVEDTWSFDEPIEIRLN